MSAIKQPILPPTVSKLLKKETEFYVKDHHKTHKLQDSEFSVRKEIFLNHTAGKDIIFQLGTILRWLVNLKQGR